MKVARFGGLPAGIAEASDRLQLNGARLCWISLPTADFRLNQDRSSDWWPRHEIHTRRWLLLRTVRAEKSLFAKTQYLNFLASSCPIRYQCTREAKIGCSFDIELGEPKPEISGQEDLSTAAQYRIRSGPAPLICLETIDVRSTRRSSS